METGKLTGWVPASKRSPCPVCGGPDNCKASSDGNAVWCGRNTDSRCDVNRGGQSLWKLDSYGTYQPAHRSGPLDNRGKWQRHSSKLVVVDRTENKSAVEKAEQFYLSCGESSVPESMIVDGLPVHGPRDRDAWAIDLSVPAAGLDALGVRYGALRVIATDTETGQSQRAFLTFIEFPEVSNHGFHRRYASDIGFKSGELRKKYHKAGTPRGCTAAPSLGQQKIHCVEGMTDGAVLAGNGLSVVTRPNNRMGGADLATIIETNERLIVWGENDQKPDGRWPGKEGAEQVAADFCEITNRPVQVVYPDGVKDIREWWIRYCRLARVNPVSPTPDQSQAWRNRIDAHVFESSKIVVCDQTKRTEYLNESIEEIAGQLEIKCSLAEPCGVYVQLALPVNDSDLFEWIMGRARCRKAKCDDCASIYEFNFALKLAGHWEREQTREIYRLPCTNEVALRIIRLCRKRNDRGARYRYAWCRRDANNYVLWSTMPMEGAELLDSAFAVKQLLEDAQRGHARPDLKRRLGTCRAWPTSPEKSNAKFLDLGDRELAEDVIAFWNQYDPKLNLSYVTKPTASKAFSDIGKAGLIADLATVQQFADNIRQRMEIFNGK